MLGVAFEMKKLNVPANWLLIWRGCDINIAQKIAMCGKNESRRRWTGPCHFWPSVQKMLPEDVRNNMIEVAPEEDADREERSTTFCLQSTYMRAAHKPQAGFSAEGCILHPGQKCPVISPNMTYDNGNASQRRLRVNFSGPQFLPWCGSGLCLGPADPSMESYYSYAANVRSDDIDMRLLENASNFPFDMWVDDIKPEAIGT